MWRDIHLAVRALYDPQAAILQFNANQGYTPEAGESKAHTYMWIHNLNRLGKLEKAVTADVANYNVFNKNGVRSYVAYNPTNTAITVHFSDGQTLVVPARKIASNFSQTSPIDDGFVQEANDAANGQVNFWFKPNQTASSVELHYKINQGSFITVIPNQKDALWQSSITGVKTGDNISYYYVYVINGQKFQSSSFLHTYSIGGDDTTGNEDRFSYTLKSADNGTVQVIFTPKTKATFVDLHYKINGTNQQNVRMTDATTSWNFTITGLKTNDKIDFSFTYQVADGAFDSKLYQYTYQPLVSLMKLSRI